MSTNSNAFTKNQAVTQEVQSKLTPDSVLQDLQEGNERFVQEKNQLIDHKALVSQTVGGQFPKAVVLSCIDSRVPVETVFDQAIGDLFVARVAGNIVNEDVLGSLEYSCKVAGSKLVLVLGHGACGAVKAACDHVELGNITALLDKIQPAVSGSKVSGDRNSSNSEFVADVIELNVKNSIDMILKQSPILAEMESKGEIKIVGGIYHLTSGKVEMI